MLQDLKKQGPEYSLLPLWQRMLLLALGFFACAWLGFFISPANGTVVSYWLPGGLLVAVLLVNPTRDWPWLVAAVLPANVSFELWHDPGSRWPMISIFYASNVFQAVVGGGLVRRWVAEKPRLFSLTEFFGLIGLVGLTAAVSAAMGTAALVGLGLAKSFVAAWSVWWGGNIMAVLVLSPLVLVFGSRRARAAVIPWSWLRVLEAAAVYGGMLLLLWYVLVVSGGIISTKIPVLVFVMWAGLRFGMSGATVMVFLLAVVTSYLTTHFQHGLTLMAIQSGSYIITLQVFVAVAALVGLVPTIVLSERNRALARVGAGEAQLRATLETTPAVAVQWFDLAGRVKYWNRASEIFYGWTAAEAMGRTLDELIFTKEQADGFAVALAQIEKSGQPIGPVEFTFRHRDGHSGVLLSTVFQIPHSSGEPRFVCMDVDVTERKFEEEINRTQMMVLEMISAGQPMPETLDALLRRVETQAPDTSASILLTTEDRGHLRHGAAPSLPVEYVKALGEFAIGPEMGSCGTAAWRREPVYVADIDTDPLWASFKQIVLPHGLKACWSAPILDGRKNVLGTLAVYHRQPGLPDEHQIRLLQMATHTAAVCIGKDFAERERRESLVREQQARANYTAQLIAGQEAERKRIAAEIHDSLGQNLSLIKNLAQIALRSQNPASSYEHLAAISNLAQQCISEARELSRELHPYQIEHLGLKRSLELLLENIAQASAEMKFQWKFDDVAEILSSESSTNLYRVVQESLNNALKHSRAQNVSVTLERDIHELQIIIRDDGCGFAAGENPPGMGLRNISERVRMLGGRLTITSSPGNGTRLEAVIPVADVEEVSGGEII